MEGRFLLSGYELRPGERGIVALTLITPVAICLGVANSQDRTDCHKITLSIAALCFFTWAVYKNVTSSQFEDLGVISFGTVLMAAFSIPKPRSGLSREEKIRRVKAATLNISLACACVAGHYAYVWFTFEAPQSAGRLGFREYLLYGVFWWLSAMVWTCSALCSQMKQIQNSDNNYEEEVLMDAEGADGLARRFRVLLAQ